MSLHDLYQRANNILSTAVDAAWNYAIPWWWVLPAIMVAIVIAAVLERIRRPLP